MRGWEVDVRPARNLVAETKDGDMIATIPRFLRSKDDNLGKVFGALEARAFQGGSIHRYDHFQGRSEQIEQLSSYRTVRSLKQSTSSFVILRPLLPP